MAQPGETQPYGFDFVNDLAAGERVVGATWALTVSSGSDPTPAVRLSGGPFLRGTTITEQLITGLLDGVVYIVTATARTSAGNTLQMWSHIPCVDSF